MNTSSQLSLFAAHKTRHHQPSRPAPCCPSDPGDVFEPKGPGGSGYPHQPLAPPPADGDDDYSGKGPGGSGYPASFPVGGDFDCIC